MLVEDDDTVRIMLRELIGVLAKKEGLEIDIIDFDNTAAALVYFQEISRSAVPDLIITDKDCPQISSGIGLCAALIQDPNFQNTRLVLISGNLEEIDYEFARLNNIKTLPKPVYLPDLKKLLF